MVCAFIDAEHALDVVYAKNLGVDTDNLLVSQPDFGEQALDVLETLTRSGAVDLIVVDSVAALTPKSEIEGDMGDTHVGLQARLMSQALRKLTAILHKTNTTVIFINQIRMKIGTMGYGSGNRVKAKVVKNKVAPPFRQAEFDIMFGEGISFVGELIDYGVKMDIIDKSGAWFSYGSEKLGQGKENSKITIKENPEMMAEIEGKIKEALGFGESLTVDESEMQED